MDVLVYMAERAGEVVSRGQLETAVWSGTVVGYDSVTSTMLKLRKAFGDDPRNPRVLETVPKRGYRLVAMVIPDRSPPPVTESSRPGKWQRYAVWLPVAALLAITGAVLLARPWQPNSVVTAPDNRNNSIVVLPFENTGGDSRQQYLADGITDDLITDLTRISSLFVIARDSAFTYQHETRDVVHIARELHVRYVLHGSVRRAGDLMRINTQLTDAVTGKQVWADRMDGAIEELLAYPDRISRKIVSALSVDLTDSERQLLAQRDTEDHAAYEQFLQGEALFYRYARTSNRAARALFERALVLDPDYARAYAMLAWTHTFDFMNGWSDSLGESLNEGIRLASRALELDPSLPLAFFVRGLAYREQGEYVKALVEAEHAVALDTNYANGHVLHATLLYYAGRPREGLERMKTAIRLNPRHPFNYPFHLGQAYFVLGEYDQAIAAFKEGLNSNPASERLRVWLAAAYARSNRLDEAKWEIAQVLTVNPEFSLARISRAFPFKDPSDLERFVGGLRLAGLAQ